MIDIYGETIRFFDAIPAPVFKVLLIIAVVAAMLGAVLLFSAKKKRAGFNMVGLALCTAVVATILLDFALTFGSITLVTQYEPVKDQQVADAANNVYEPTIKAVHPDQAVNGARIFTATYEDGRVENCEFKQDDLNAPYYHVKGKMVCSQPESFFEPPLKKSK